MADEGTVLDKVQQALKVGQSGLDLRALNLTSLPPEIGELQHLRSLNVSDNDLSRLPAEIGQLHQLNTLDASNNKLESLPLEFGRLTKLQTLNLWNNQLKQLPREFMELSSLSNLDLGANPSLQTPQELTALKKLKTFTFDRQSLKTIPPEIIALEQLESLQLYNNEITWLPQTISNLGNLGSLDLSSNLLTTIPSSIQNLTNLYRLHLGHNRFSSFPLEITRLSQLERLSINSNKISSLPPQIANLTKLSDLDLSDNELRNGFTHLEELPILMSLDLSGNGLSKLDFDIAKLKTLRELRLSQNPFTRLPTSLLELADLTGLNMSQCKLTALPAGIQKLKKLTVLNLRQNELTIIPDEMGMLRELTVLNLSGNQLTSLPPELTTLTKLTSLDLRGNQLPISPEALENPKDVKAIFAALAGLATGARLNEAKMLVVGDGKVGKSSVVQQVLYGTYNPDKQTTLGVDISDEMKIVESEVEAEGEPIKLNVWDFGGQEIQHATHQFFLTTRSLYLLVVDARKGDQISGVEYWLKLIQSFGGNSPIIIVINQIDQLKGQRALNLDRNALLGKYNIRAFIETSCATGEGIRNLRNAIAEEVEHLNHVHDIWPTEWLAIKGRIKAMKADYIPVEKFLEICIEENLHDTDLQQSLLGLLNDLGVIIRFPGDTQVLNPRWVTQAVYGLLTSGQLVRTQGQFDLKDVELILNTLPDGRDRYPKHTHLRLIEVMKHFELCFEFTDRLGHYLIPRHLHDSELDIPWNDDDTLQFQYHYVEALPDSIISRFIVRMNQFITKQYYWKNGVFLQSGENRAKVKADLVDRKIFISISGKEQTRRAFLAVIRSAFEEINKNFTIEVKQLIPVPSSPNVLVSYYELLIHEEMNELEIVIPDLRTKLSVKELLDGVEDLPERLRRRARNVRNGDLNPPMSEERDPLPPGSQRNNPWLSGSFYLLSYVIIIATILISIVVLNNYGISRATLAIVPLLLIGGLLSVGIVGANQLRNDDRLTNESYVKLMLESYRRLPLLRGGPESKDRVSKPRRPGARDG